MTSKNSQGIVLQQAASSREELVLKRFMNVFFFLNGVNYSLIYRKPILFLKELNQLEAKTVED